MSRWAVVVLAVATLAAAFFMGRASVATSREPVGKARSAVRRPRAAFAVYDGVSEEPYIVVLRRGGPLICTPSRSAGKMKPGTEYRACGGRSAPVRALSPTRLRDGFRLTLPTRCQLLRSGCFWEAARRSGDAVGAMVTP
jgi:hypothetical protein